MNPKQEEPEANVRVPLIGSVDEAISALQENVLQLHDWIDLKNPDKGTETVFGLVKNIIRTTPWEEYYLIPILPQEVGFLINLPSRGTLVI